VQKLPWLAGVKLDGLLQASAYCFPYLHSMQTHYVHLPLYQNPHGGGVCVDPSLPWSKGLDIKYV